MDSVVKHVRMMNTQIESLTSRNELMNTQIESLSSHKELPTKGLEWEIKEIREKFKKKERLFSDPFYVGNYKFKGCAYFDTEHCDNSFGIFLCLCIGLLDDSLTNSLIIE